MKKKITEYSDVITVAEMQSILRIGRNKAYELLRNGTIKSIRIGSKYIIPTDNVRQYINSYTN